MKRVLYVMPAIMVAIFYSMLALLAGGFASFQLRAWLMILLPALSGLLLVLGKWWGCVPGMVLGGGLIFTGLMDDNEIVLLFGSIVAVYYLAMGIVCLIDAGKKKQ